MNLVMRFLKRRLSRTKLIMSAGFLLAVTCVFVILTRQLPMEISPGSRSPQNMISNHLSRTDTARDQNHNSSIVKGFRDSDQLKNVPLVGRLTRDRFRESAETMTQRQKAIVEAMRHSWAGYKKYAWGWDHLKPISKSSQTWFGLGLTILDSLDSLLMMGMEEEFDEALNWLKSDLSFDVPRDVNCFETTIRCLGGLLTAYHLTGERAILIKSVDLADRLIHCFDSRTAVPFSDVNLRTKLPRAPAWAAESSTSEVSTLQLEFRDIAHITKNFTYENVAFRASKHLHDLVAKSGDPLVPIYINPYTGSFRRSTVTLGARGDSYYEYLLKQFLQTGLDWLEDDYLVAAEAIQKRMVSTSSGPLKLTFVGELLADSHGSIHPKMDHLVCFLAGTLALGHYHSLRVGGRGAVSARGHSVPQPSDHRYSSHLQTAEDLARTCYHMYNLTATGLSPEIAYFGINPGDDDLEIRAADAHNLLRPEYVESLFYLYHITGNEMYREQGWKIFLAFQRYTRVESGGFTTISDVRHPEAVRPRDMQESFWLSETLKYLFLLFCDDRILIDEILNDYIFNTEGHLVPRRVSSSS